MDQNWERRQSFLREENNNVEVWESNSSDEESSIGEYEGTDLTMMQVNEVELEELCSCEFPRDDLCIVLDGLNKFPWTVYPIHLKTCLAAAAKIAQGGREDFESRRLQTLYREAVPSAFEKCLDDKAIWKWNNDIHNNIFDACLRLMDVVAAKLPQLLLDDLSFEEELLPLLRTLAIVFDKQCQFHLKHKEQSLPPSASSFSAQPLWEFARPMPGTPTRLKTGDWHCLNRKIPVKEAEGCECLKCRPPDVYTWVSYFLNYFGRTAYGNGYQLLLRVLSCPQKLLPAVMEALLLPVARSTEFITDEVAAYFSEPCARILRYVEELLERDVDALSDKTRDGSFGALSLILKHLQVIIGRSSSAEKAESMTSVVQRRMVERMLGFNSFNKQLSAVREINKLLENARAIAARDKSRSVNATMQWLEKNDILRHVLRSHLHHKQYVDQVEKIMRFLLQERRLSEEHLDAIWAATEKPDQFETVKANIFDLLADLAWSFSPEQLDSLFGRFERSQGRSPSDIVKILTLVKKLARSDTKGVMAQRLLELLWNMLHSGEASAEVLESGALNEILGHYDSVNRASKDEYICKCLKNVENGISVIPSLRLLRGIVLLDNEKPFYQGEISRQMRLQKLIQDNGLINMIVKSMEQHMATARAMSSEKLVATKSNSVADCRYTHEQHVRDRLEFLLFAIQAGDVRLPWDATERLWNCMIEAPVFHGDKERGLQWLCSALDKTPCLSLEAMLNILTKKLTCIDPASLTETAWRCFMRLFVWVNLYENKLVRVRNEDFITQDLDLTGISYMWEAALSSPLENIAQHSISMLRDIHTCLSESLAKNIVTIRQGFINECLRNLTSALENEEQRNSTTDSNSVSMVDGEGVEVDNYASSIESETDKTHSIKSEKDFYRVERCLRILKEFIIKCEGVCPRKIPAHGASFQGRPMTLGVSTANKQSTRLDIAVHANEYLGSFRMKVAERLECPVSRVRLMHANKELKQDSQVLRQLGLTDGQPLIASVNIVDRVEEEMDELQLPGVLISQNTQMYDILFRLADSSHPGVREGSNCLLSLLPTHPGILNEFQNLHKKPASKAREFLSLQLGAHSRLLYTLQIVDGLLMPVNRAVISQRFRVDFIRFGGFQHLMTVFEPGAMLGVDSQTRRGCYTSALRILKLLLSETQSTSSSENTRVIGTETTTREESENESTISVNDSQSDGEKKFNELEVIDMGIVAGALKRLTWATALGQISMLANSAPLVEILRNNQRFDKNFDAMEGFLNQDDRYLCLEALDLLVTCLLSHRSLLGTFFSSPDVGRFIVDMVLQSRDEYVRYQAASSFLRLSKIASESGNNSGVHRHVMAALIDSKAEANNEPKRCLPFMELLGQLFYSIKGPEEYAMGEQQLHDELEWLKHAPETVDDDDKLLEGHLGLIRVLVEVLDRRVIGSSKPPHGRGLVRELIENFLFLESALLWKMEEDSNVESDKVLQSRCGTRRSRERAFQLLTCLATHCVENLKEIVDLLIKLHFSADIPEWEHLPSYGRKGLSGYVGLKNAGATCYMNSVFQQLYMQPEVRRTVLECTLCEDTEKSDSVFFQLQAMFGALLGSSLDHYTPQGFWDAYRDYDGMPINLREHQDAFEFFNRLYDTIDDTLKTTRQETTLTKIFGGVFVQQVISRGCSHCSEREEPFAAISVDVKNKRDLLESLESFVRGDLLEADNAYYCEECGRKVDALKRVCVKSLPQTLIVHLKRFDFDYETMQRLKLKDRFEFPMHLDMKPYTVEGLALRESQSQDISSPGATSNGGADGSICNENGSTDTSKPDSYYQYELVGVVVHSGTAFAGHYYSYIKERNGDCERWIAFDDKRVEPYDINDLEKDCFGGKYSIDVYDNFLKTMSPQEFDRPNSAYMLLYERSRNYTPVDSPAATSHTKGEDDDGDKVMKDNLLTARPFNGQLRMPTLIHRSVRKENLRFVHENHLLDKDYFRFLYSLIEANMSIIDGRALHDGRERKGETSGRRLDMSAKQDMNDFAEQSIRLALEFMFRVYLRTHSSLREDFHPWKVLVIIWNLVDYSITSCKRFLNILVERPQWVQDYLLRCPVDEVRQAFATLLVHALKKAVNIYRGNVYYVDENGRQQDPLSVDAMIDTLKMLIREATSPKSYIMQYFQVLLEYARVGPYPRLHLLQKNIVNHLVTFATKFQIAKQDAVYLHTIVSLLVRSCDTSKLYDEPEAEKVEENETKPAQANPHQFGSVLGPLPKDVADAIFRHHLYTSVLIKTCPEQEETIKLLEFCCWRNENLSLAILQDVMDALHLAVNTEVAKPILSLAFRLMQLGDSLQATRQEILLLGYENVPSGLMDLLVSKGVVIHKRYCLIKFIVKLVELYPSARVHVMGRKNEWKRVVDWLQQELHVVGGSSSSGISTVSNEDLVNGYLMRTNSAEWTLTSARKLFSSSS